MNIQARQLRVGDLVDLQSDICAVQFHILYPELKGEWVQVCNVDHQAESVIVGFLDAGSILFPRDHKVTVWKPLGFASQA